ncbi:MAG: hypothetical protein ACKVVP_05615 [Chloroflexota bacterium]
MQLNQGDRQRACSQPQSGRLAAPDLLEERGAVAIAARALRGIDRDDLRNLQLTPLDFVINLKTDQALSITIPPSVLDQATEVIQ